MKYQIFESFLADAEACEYCSVLISGHWIEITDWNGDYAADGLLSCRAWDKTVSLSSGPSGQWVKSLIVLDEIQAVHSDVS